MNDERIEAWEADALKMDAVKPAGQRDGRHHRASERARAAAAPVSPLLHGSRWFAHHSKSVIFVIIVIAMVGIFQALTIPVAVFPSTDFPRVVIGIDNGVMPIDQMMVTITRPLEQAVNSVQGLETIQSVTSRGSAEIDLYFDWNVDMFQTLQRVNSALSAVQASLPPTVRIESHRLTFASFPILGYSLTADRTP